jgi:hypothetical protein
MNFTVGDIVCTKDKGPPGTGIIRAAYDATFYSWACREKVKHIKWANRREPDMDDHHYTVEFPEPIRVITVDEIMEEFGWKYNESLEYLETLSKHKYIDYPEKYLEMFRA